MNTYTMEQAHRLQDLAESIRDRTLTLKDVKAICAEEYPELKVHTGRCDREMAYHVLMNNAETTYEQIEKGQPRQYVYCRVSSTDQDTTVQREIMSKAYPEAVILEEVASATSTENRPKLALILEAIHKGDSLLVWKLDRLARNMNDLTTIVSTLEERGASLVIHDQRIDTGTAAGKAFLQMLGVFAEFETNLRKERQAAGIAKAKAEGKYKGRKPTAKLQATQIASLKASGMGATAIAKELGIGRASVYRVLAEV